MSDKSFLRLRKRADFLALRNGEKRRGPFFLLESKSRDLPEEIKSTTLPRVGFTVTRKNGNAVKRNRIKRRLREAFRLSLKRDIAAGTDYVIIARPDALEAPFDSLTGEMERRFRQKLQNSKR